VVNPYAENNIYLIFTNSYISRKQAKQVVKNINNNNKGAVVFFFSRTQNGYLPPSQID